MIASFSVWSKWAERKYISKIQSPGVYIIALSEDDISGMPFSWRNEIMYIGMTTSELRYRLQQFDNSINGKDGHGGAHRVVFKYSDYRTLTSRLYVSICPQELEVSSNIPANLRIKGEILKHEYECLAIFVENFGQLPEFNDQKRSLKK